jgi:hypothetical protein
MLWQRLWTDLLSTGSIQASKRELNIPRCGGEGFSGVGGWYRVDNLDQYAATNEERNREI